MAAGACPPHAHRHLARHLEDVAVQQEEPGQAVALDQPQLLVQPCPGVGAVGRAGVAALELVAADACERRLGGLAALGEVRVAVAQVLGEVEAAPVGHLEGAANRRGGEAGGRLGRRPQHRLVVAAPLGLARLQGGVAPDRHQGVLQERAAAGVGMGVAGRHGPHPQPLGQLGEQPVAARIAACVRPLQLDREPVAPEHRPQPHGQLLGLTQAALAHRPGQDAVTGAARQAVQAVGVPGDLVERRRGSAPVAGMGGGDQAAQVAIAGRGLDQQGEMRAACEGDLGAGHRPQADLTGGAGEGQRPAQAIVVGQRHRLVAERRRTLGQLLGLGGPVQEREARVGMKLRICSTEHTFARA